ncbi:MAG: FkbM family methyltransferase [Alphaproteobacteria bacterium]|nr:FkbM family methyltransferase [Alphaproteobacteria bacterium]
MRPAISYAQRYEDMHLLRALGGQSSGFYIDIGAGHPVYDNVSFAFYLHSWRGITVEPNPWLAQLSEAVRPRDVRVPSLVGETAGEATYYLVEDFHGLSTTVEDHARAAKAEYGKSARAMTIPVATLRALCEAHAPAIIDFLKIDVEGAERAVLAGGDWKRFRPRIVVLEALEPVTLQPAWETWESLLLGFDYRFAYFDSLNRYYVASEHADLAKPLAAAPTVFEGVTPFHRFEPALVDPSHPDHGLAQLLAGEDMVRLPLMSFDTMAERLTGGLDPASLKRPAQPPDIAAAHQRLFGTPATTSWAGDLALAPNATIRDLYRSAVVTAPFRAACGRISASTAW